MLPVIVINDALRLFSPGRVSISVDTASIAASLIKTYVGSMWGYQYQVLPGTRYLQYQEVLLFRML